MKLPTQAIEKKLDDAFSRYVWLPFIIYAALQAFELIKAKQAAKKGSTKTHS